MTEAASIAEALATKVSKAMTPIRNPRTSLNARELIAARAANIQAGLESSDWPKADASAALAEKLVEELAARWGMDPHELRDRMQSEWKALAKGYFESRGNTAGSG